MSEPDWDTKSDLQKLSAIIMKINGMSYADRMLTMVYNQAVSVEKKAHMRELIDNLENGASVEDLLQENLDPVNNPN